MQKKFITNLAFLLFLNLLIKPFWIFGVDRTVQNMTGAEEYGTYFALLNFSFLFNILLDVGINNYNNRNIAQNNDLLEEHFSGIFSIKFLLGIIYGSIVLVVGLIIDYSPFQLKLLSLLAVNQFLISLIYYLRSNLSGLHFFKTDSIISILDRTLMLIIASLLIWSNWFTIKIDILTFILIQTLSYAVTALVAFIIVLKKAKKFRFELKIQFIRTILKQSAPFALLILLMMLYSRIDAVMIERVLDNGAKQAGIYAQSYRLLDAFNMIAYLFAGILLPIFSKMLKEKVSTESLTNLSFKILVIPSIIIAITCFFYSQKIMNLLYFENITAAASLFSWLILSFIPIASSYIFGTLLTANNSLKYLNIMAVGGVALNVSLNYILIPVFKAEGAAYATLFTQLTTAIFQIILVQKLLHFRVNFRLISTTVLLIISTLFIVNSTLQFFDNWFLGFVMSVLISLSISFILKLIDIRSLYQILKKGI